MQYKYRYIVKKFYQDKKTLMKNKIKFFLKKNFKQNLGINKNLYIKNSIKDILDFPHKKKK